MANQPTDGVILENERPKVGHNINPFDGHEIEQILFNSSPPPPNYYNSLIFLLSYKWQYSTKFPLQNSLLIPCVPHRSLLATSQPITTF